MSLSPAFYFYRQFHKETFTFEQLFALDSRLGMFKTRCSRQLVEDLAGDPGSFYRIGLEKKVDILFSKKFQQDLMFDGDFHNPMIPSDVFYEYVHVLDESDGSSLTDYSFSFTNDFFLFTSIFLLFSYGILIKLSKTKMFPDLKNHFLVLSLLVLLSLFSLYSSFYYHHSYLYNTYFYCSSSSNFISLLLIFFTCLVFLVMYSNIRSLCIDHIEYYILFLTSLFALNMLVNANEIISFFFLIELQSIVSYILTGLNRRIKNTLQSGIKYFIIGGISSTSVIIGFIFLYSCVGSTSFEDIKIYLDSNVVLNINAYIGLFFVTLGFFGKFYVAPFHWWIIDVYEHAPSATTMFFSTVPFFSFYTVLYKLYAVVFHSCYDFYVTFLFFGCYLSMIIGSVGALMQKRLKRLIAYSSITMIGYMLSLFLNSSDISFLSGINLFFFYGISVSGVFCFFFNFDFISKKRGCPSKGHHSIEDLNSLGNFKSNMFLKFLVALHIYAVLGLPPMPLFFQKFFVLSHLSFYDSWFLMFIFVLTSMVSAYYYLYIIKSLFYTSSPSICSKSNSILISYSYSLVASYIICALVLLQFQLFFFSLM